MGEGERLHAQQRKRFWRLMGGLMLVGFATGLATSIASHAGTDGSDLPLWAKALGTAAVALVALVVTFGSWRFFAKVDEVEVLDNLWASLVGFYAYGTLFPCWWVLWRLRIAPAPDQMVIFGVVIVVACAAYGIRKWNAR